MKLRVDSKYVPLLATVAVLVLLYLGGCIAFGDRGFTKASVIRNLLVNNAMLGVAAIGTTFVILSGGIDLSVGAVAACCSILIATLTFDPTVRPELAGQVNPFLPNNLPPVVAFAVALAFGSLLGAAMGSLIHFYKLPPFLVTLAGMFFARGMGFVIKAKSLGIAHPFYTRMLPDDLAIRLTDRMDLPFSVVCFGALFLVALYLLHLRRLGRNIYAIGGDERSANLMGLPVGRTKILTYAFAGFCSATAGIILTFDLGSGNPGECMGFELEAIAATVIGGTLLSGGVGFLAGTLMGVLICGLIQTLITYGRQTELDTASKTRIIIGALLLLFILLQKLVAAATRRGKRIAPS